MKRIFSKERADAIINKGAFLVDMRDPVAYRDGHVEGAKNLPLKNFLNTIMGMDRKKTLFVYGSDSDIEHGVKYAETLGFSNIFVSDYEAMNKPGVEAYQEHELKQLAKESPKPAKKARKKK